MKNKTINNVFEEVASKYHSNTAIISEDKEYTYQQLEERARALSHHLKAHGVEPGGIVAISLSSSLKSIISMIAVSKVGAAYVIVPSDYPEQRQRYLLEDSGARWVISEQTSLNSKKIYLILFQDSPRPITSQTTVQITGADIAYLIYTSGSTGSPKGVAITHGGITNLVSPGQQYVQFSSQKTILQFAPLTFDAAAFEIWGALLNGARLILIPSSYQRIAQLSHYLTKYQVDILLLTPALFNSIVENDITMLAHLSQLLVGGDVMSITHARKYLQYKRELGTPFLFHNVYGPTEGTTLVSYFDMRELSDNAHRAPIGKSILGASIYLLDEDYNPVEENQIGEIYIVGKSVTLGYINQPGLTSLRYLPSPFYKKPNKVMYATGDFGRRLKNDGIEFIGRRDTQVKVRGHRNELSEIELQLLAISTLQSICVTYHKDETTGSENLLCHYVLKEEETAPTPATLRAQSKQLLPSYMVPNLFIKHPEFPLTNHGKIDRQKLVEAWKSKRGNVRLNEIHSDLTETERLIAPLWKNILSLESISKETNFFTNGGNSLLAIQLVAKLEKNSVQASIEDLFRHPVFEEFCRVVKVVGCQNDRSKFTDLQRSLWASILRFMKMMIFSYWVETRFQLFS